MNLNAAREVLETIKQYDRIKAAVWWNYADYTADGTVARSYFIDDSEGMIEIVKQNID